MATLALGMPVSHLSMALGSILWRGIIIVMISIRLLVRGGFARGRFSIMGMIGGGI
ncbi:hypothetical protein BJY04DRAFT_203841, partial [Aspergillus karnatakaensis]|uniref:uncharacterized protein n=1 Tax=Aspergillus karnatakaensis TaxID=1810916 RepID=UPI003CCE176F